MAGSGIVESQILRNQLHGGGYSVQHIAWCYQEGTVAVLHSQSRSLDGAQQHGRVQHEPHNVALLPVLRGQPAVLRQATARQGRSGGAAVSMHASPARRRVTKHASIAGWPDTAAAPAQLAHSRQAQQGLATKDTLKLRTHLQSPSTSLSGVRTSAAMPGSAATLAGAAHTCSDRTCSGPCTASRTSRPDSPM